MPIVTIDPENLEAGRTAIAAAAAELRAGRLVAFPTETVYGLGADATNGLALAAIFERKGRPRINPLIVHVGSFDEAANLVTFDASAHALASAFWPGPLTLVLPRTPDCPVHDLASAGLPTLAVRVPAHPIAHALIAATGRPIAAPSANRSGEPSPTQATHVAESLGDAGLTILDGGPCAAGLESTVIGFEDGRAVLLRAGSLPREEIEKIAGPLAAARDDNAHPSSPGRLLRHYAPRARLRLNAAVPEPGEFYLSFGPAPASSASLALSATGDLREAAANLFAHLREADRRGAARIAVAPIPLTGLGEAINDRLSRAAAAQG
ncbi:Threonylcarbamoyl-AMP synthase [Alphaproteobacteria bacterium SO-S41]|nr:Threonylcarbamoyl-AMP synthase [Alphaproteobacteria bacterium SO-S41]